MTGHGAMSRAKCFLVSKEKYDMGEWRDFCAAGSCAPLVAAAGSCAGASEREASLGLWAGGPSLAGGLKTRSQPGSI